MRRVLVALVAFLAVTAVSFAETVYWDPVTQYVDNTVIPQAKQQMLSYEIQYRVSPATTWTVFGIATGGVSSYTAPTVIPGGALSYWRLQTISVADNNTRSAWSAEFPFVQPFQVPGAPSGVRVR